MIIKGYLQDYLVIVANILLLNKNKNDFCIILIQKLAKIYCKKTKEVYNKVNITRFRKEMFFHDTESPRIKLDRRNESSC